MAPGRSCFYRGIEPVGPQTAQRADADRRGDGRGHGDRGGLGSVSSFSCICPIEETYRKLYKQSNIPEYFNK